jgi:hypothetical protein
MIIIDLEYGEPITQKIILGGATDQISGRVMSVLLSPDYSTIVASADSRFGGSALGLISASVEAFAFTDTFNVDGGFASTSGSAMSASATSEF